MSGSFLPPGEKAGLNVDLHPDQFADIEDLDKRVWLIAYARTGNKSRAARAAGLYSGVEYTKAWAEDEQFQEAFKLAQKIAVDGLNDEARRRATEGVKKHKFDRGGAPIRHPEECLCGHHMSEHTSVAVYPDSEDHDLRKVRDHYCPGEDPEDPGARTFVGIPYVETEYSDGLLIRLLQAYDTRWKDKLEVTRGLDDIPWERLPDEAIRRINSGEDPDVVLATLASQMKDRLLSEGVDEPDSDE